MSKTETVGEAGSVKIEERIIPVPACEEQRISG
jgi:hypothetical protein